MPDTVYLGSKGLLLNTQARKLLSHSHRYTKPKSDPIIEPNPHDSMAAASTDSGELILVEPAKPGSPVAVVTINRPKALNALTRSMMISLAAAFRRLDADDGVAAVVLAGRGRAFCSGVDLTAAEEVFKGDVKDPAADPVIQMERCRKPIVGAIAGFAVTAGFEIALACDIIVAGRSAKFIDTHAKFGIFPSWGLSQKLSRVIGPNRAREVSLTCMPVTAEMAEKWGLVNHIVDDSQVLSKAVEVAEAIARNNRNLVMLYKSVINDGLQLDLEHARTLEKERAHDYYNGMTKEQFANMQKFIQGRSKAPSKL
uniref:Enoyl-CoA hydratase n=1 Tax=Leersia perrieri TaxID=77586 RepID=A0A0D9VT93_9ORYZ